MIRDAGSPATKEAKLTAGKRVLRILVWPAVFVLQLIMTQLVTLMFSFLLPDMENFPQTQPAPFVIVLGITFSTGIFLVGWAALRWRWLEAKPVYRARLAGTLLGAYLPLILALVLYRTLDPGNPFFFISILTGILGFWLPGWIERG
jgi:hypothetical protein